MRVFWRSSGFGAMHVIEKLRGKLSCGLRNFCVAVAFCVTVCECGVFFSYRKLSAP